ncbi:hypothetical protein BVX97_04255 [bacterium E08(2017)]|nr:hypothetical protein BVX97_04255 [bacterium E08(2017)]
MDDVRRTLEEWINADDDKCRQLLVTGFHGLFRAYKDEYYRKVARSADLWIPDGIAPVLLARLNGLKGVERTPGMDVMKMYMELANEKGYSSFFYGETRQVLDKMKENLEKDYPNHKIAGMYAPPFKAVSEEEDEKIVGMINDSRADIVWIGLGLPKQDIWGYKRKEQLKAKAVIGIGAAFGFIAGEVDRCPDWIGKNGFEWAYRLAKEPDKLWKRDLVEAPQFLWHVFLERTGLKKYE